MKFYGWLRGSDLHDGFEATLYDLPITAHGRTVGQTMYDLWRRATDLVQTLHAQGSDIPPASEYSDRYSRDDDYWGKEVFVDVRIPKKTKAAQVFSFAAELQRACDRVGIKVTSDSISLFNYEIDETRRMVWVSLYTDNEVFGRGLAVCGPNDKFDILTGTKIAIFRAIRDLKRGLEQDCDYTENSEVDWSDVVSGVFSRAS